MAVQRGSPPQTPWNTFLNEIHGYIGASAALEKLTRAGLDRDEVYEWLFAIVGLEVLSGRGQKLRDVQIAGVALSTLDRYPNQIRNWAKKIGQLNDRLQADPFVRSAAETVGKLTSHQPQQLLEFPLLRDRLSLFAWHLEVIAAVFRVTRGRTRSGFGGLREAFNLWVYEKTGHKHYSHLATLLSAAFYAIGLKGKKYSAVDEHSLQVNYGRSALVASLRKEADPAAAAEEWRRLALDICEWLSVRKSG